MSDVMNRLTDYELSRIEYRRRQRGQIESQNSAKNCDFASNSDFLAEWAKAKNSFLGDVFGDKLIVEKEIEVKISDNILYNRFEGWRFKKDFVSDFFKQLDEAVCANEKKIAFTNKDRKELDYYDFGCFIYSAWLDNPKALANNTQYEDTYYLTYGDKTIKFQKGSKIMRNLGKLVKLLGLDRHLFEKVQNYHSRLLNDTIIRGTLCLSIHPLDYMTMSDNSHDWTSCMSWDTSRGCYRQGTVEMLNSSSAVVAYIKADTPYYISDDKDMFWNSKKWRTLLVATPQFVASVKSYPYSHSELECIAINMLADLISKSNNALNYTKPEEANYMKDYIVTFEGQRQFFFDFDTFYMYNDFENTNKYFVAAEKHFLLEYDEDTMTNYYHHYSGFNQCIWCGRINSISDEACLCCDHCNHSIHCSCCDVDITDEEQFVIEGAVFCEDCYNKLARRSIFYPDFVFNKNYEKIVGFYRDLGDGKAVLFKETFEVGDMEIFDPIFKDLLGKATIVRRTQRPLSYSYFFVVNIDNIKEEFFSEYLHYIPTTLTNNILVSMRGYNNSWGLENFDEVLKKIKAD